jgi:CBS domain containing-hemolysin-like protein
VLVKDIYNSIVRHDQPLEPVNVVRDCLRPPLLVPESQQVSKLFEMMRMDRVHLAIVMDEYGAFSGVVTMEDMLEEIVGEISDELDVDEPETLVLWVDDHWETEGSVAVTDLARITGIAFPEIPDANTINGLFMKQLDRMPKKNDEIEYVGLRFVAIDEVGNRIGKIHVYLNTVSTTDAAAAPITTLEPGSDEA